MGHQTSFKVYIAVVRALAGRYVDRGADRWERFCQESEIAEMVHGAIASVTGDSFAEWSRRGAVCQPAGVVFGRRDDVPIADARRSRGESGRWLPERVGAGAPFASGCD